MERRHLLGLAVFELGQPVALHDGSGLQIGEIVGRWGSAKAPFYDVSLMQVVKKAVPQSELRLATGEELNGLLSSLMMMPDVPGTRDALLRQRHTTFLMSAIARLRNEGNEGEPQAMPAFEVGSNVALRDGDALLLGVVRGITMRDSQPHYMVLALGDERVVAQADLLPLRAPMAAGELGLGVRVRFMAAGYENDDAFLGVLCAARQTEQGPLYAVLFDDGDVLEDLAASDLRVV